MSGRHPDPKVGRIDRARPLRFTFNGRAYTGFVGDTLASALFANGVRLVARSFKYHRPRGIYGSGAEEPCALVQLASGAYTEPNLRATQIELYDGLTATSVNAWPSVERDVGVVNDLLSRIFVAGFYYKTFMHPKSWWMRYYEPAIRRMAGMGKAPNEPDPDIYDRMHVHCDVLIVGGGPAGLAAARTAAATGARVILCDEGPELGGSLLGRRREIDGRPALEWIARTSTELTAAENVRVLTRTSAFGYYDHNYLCLLERRTDHLGPRAPKSISRQRVWHVRAKQVVLATGAHERPLVFADNDRPGIMLAGAAQTYVNRYAALPGRRAVVFTNNDSAYESALDLADAGIDITAVIDLRREAPAQWATELRRRGIEILASHAITGTFGRRGVRSVALQALSPDGLSVRGPTRLLSCDLVAVSGGWSPVVHLFSQSQGKLRFDEDLACFVPGEAAQAQVSAGAARGSFLLDACLAEGHDAGLRAADLAGFKATAIPAKPTARPGNQAPLRPIWVVPSSRPVGRKAKHFVDLQNDVTAADIRMAAREGLRSVEHVKRYTTAGMGTDQGKTSNVNALAILAEATGASIPDVGTTTFRPPYTPVSYGALAGRDVGKLADPVRTTPMHPWHVRQGAVFEDIGQWKRARYYPRPGEDMEAAVRRECLATRRNVGILDYSTLGKIDIRGADAAEFLDRVYTNAWRNLSIGRCRYGLMCGEDGMVFDDGVTTRLAEDHFHMTTTTGGAAHVLDWLEEYAQTEWPHLKVYFTSVTEQWATISVAGPKAGAVIGALAPDLPLDDASFPFMSMRIAKVAGLDARVFRISFTGELSYEINVPAYHGLALWEEAMRAGEPHGITPYGTEAMHVLRAEKGFIIAGQDTDGSVTPIDLGMDWIVSKKKKDFIGKRSLLREDTARPDRKQLVGLLTDDPQEVLPEGAQLVGDPRAVPPMPMIGHVTSSYFSAILDRSIALALVKGGRQRWGGAVYAPLPGKTVRATICELAFYPPEGATHA
ncbi:MAG TPA: sarcosine oxidase subunit alpha [Alphaproteobacteria bacterium]|nr:sarcosine oxidase subunit alpha [Alphaproteobacteria bacterium]